jgi:hypothetical protein
LQGKLRGSPRAVVLIPKDREILEGSQIAHRRITSP